MKAHLVAAIASLSIVGTQAAAQPVVALEGNWRGTCLLGGKSANASVFIDQKGARMNDVGATAFSKGDFWVKFQIVGRYVKTFSGTFSRDTSVLSGTLEAQGKVAHCTLNRKIDTPDRVCIRNFDANEIWWRLDPGSPSTAVPLLKGKDDHGAGVAGGKLCWDVTEANANSCKRSLPQSSYAC